MQKDLEFKRIVVKIGTKLLTDRYGHLDKVCMKRMAFQICKIKATGKKVVLVSSGAIASGMMLLGLKTRPMSLSKLQACAAVGQSRLIQIYEELFRKFNYLTAQILLTQEDLNDRKRFLNAKNTILTLLEDGVIPIVNENDTVSTQEIKFGDNDRLSGLVADLIEADLLILLTDVDGLDVYHPETRSYELIPVIERIGPEIYRCVRDSKDAFSVGGMRTKLQAAQMAMRSGIFCVIANGRRKDVLLDIVSGKRNGTLFLPHKERLVAKKRWIAFIAKIKGSIKVDDGAKEALIKENKSLLASGIIERRGVFLPRDIVVVIDEQNREFAKGLVNYSSSEIDRIKGLKTSQIHSTLGYKRSDEVIHKDDLVIL